MSGTAAIVIEPERLMQVLLAPVVSEKSTFVGEKNNQYVFRVLPDATKPEIKAAVELMFKVEGRIGCRRRERQGQGKALRPLRGPAQQLEEGLRVAASRARKSISRQARPSNREHHAAGQSQTHLARPPLARQGRHARAAQGQAASRALVEKQVEDAPAATTTGHITTRHRAAATSSTIA